MSGVRRAKSALASALRNLAAALESPVSATAAPRPCHLGEHPEMERANRLCAEMQLRHALHCALRRYSHQEQPAEA